MFDLLSTNHASMVTGFALVGGLGVIVILSITLMSLALPISDKNKNYRSCRLYHLLVMD